MLRNPFLAPQDSSPTVAVDILPTVLEVLNAPAPETIQGESLLPFIEGSRDDDLPAFREATTYGTEREDPVLSAAAVGAW